MHLNIEQVTEQVTAIAIAAGKLVLTYYKQQFDLVYKEDATPLTSADIACHNFITAELSRIWPDIPIISEEATVAPFAARHLWEYCWLIDPIDGTKEFINGDDEFTVNIALIYRGQVIMGVVDAPALGTTYYGGAGIGSFVKNTFGVSQLNHSSKIDSTPHESSGLVILVSKSHRETALDDYLKLCSNHTTKVVGSSLKFCTLAEGKADLYPRNAPLKEWDIAAGHAVLKFSGGNVYIMGARNEFTYNNESMIVHPFEAY